MLTWLGLQDADLTTAYTRESLRAARESSDEPIERPITMLSTGSYALVRT